MDSGHDRDWRGVGTVLALLRRTRKGNEIFAAASSDRGALDMMPR